MIRSTGTAGFTLLELVTVIAIIGILAGLALPSYTAYLLRVNRSEAIVSLLDLATCQEQIFAVTGRYDTTQCAPDGLDHYTIRIEPEETSTALGFTAWADPEGAQLDDPCGSLGLDHTGLRLINGTEADTANCWKARGR